MPKFDEKDGGEFENEYLKNEKDIELERQKELLKSMMISPEMKEIMKESNNNLVKSLKEELTEPKEKENYVLVTLVVKTNDRKFSYDNFMKKQEELLKILIDDQILSVEAAYYYQGGKKPNSLPTLSYSD